jgi:hypothetical protein
MQRAANPDFSQEFSRPPWAVASDSGRRSVSTPGVTATAINPGRSRLAPNAVSGWKLGLPITDFARFINSEIALLCGRQATATQRDLLVGLGGTDEEVARPLEGGFVGRALPLHAQRAALEPSIAPREPPLSALGPPRADRCHYVEEGASATRLG